MNKSPPNNQQTEPKQCKPEVEEIFFYQNLKDSRYSMGIIIYILK